MEAHCGEKLLILSMILVYFQWLNAEFQIVNSN